MPERFTDPEEIVHLALLALRREIIVLHGQVDSVVWDLCTFAACWILGFALYDGRLRRIPRVRLLVLGSATMPLACGGSWATWTG